MYEYDDDPEQALGDACEEYLFEAFTDCPDDQMCSVLDRVDEPKRREIIEKIREALAFYQPDPEFNPTPNAHLVLGVLANAGTTMTQVAIEAALKKAGTPVSRKSIGPIVRRLEEAGLIHYPERPGKGSPRKGMAITPKGLQYVSQSQCA